MNAIYPIRQILGLTQVSLASALGVTQPTICSYERAAGSRVHITPPPSVAIRLVDLCAAKGLQITLDHVYCLAPLPVPVGATKNEAGEHPWRTKLDHLVSRDGGNFSIDPSLCVCADKSRAIATEGI